MCDRHTQGRQKRRTQIPINMPDPIRKRFGYSQFGPLRPECSQNRAGSYNYARPDFPHPIWFCSSKESGLSSYCAKPARIRSGWRGQVLAKRICSESKPVCRDHRARFLAGGNRPATSFPLSDWVAFFNRRPGSCCAKPARIRYCSG